MYGFAVGVARHRWTLMVTANAGRGAPAGIGMATTVHLGWADPGSNEPRVAECGGDGVVYG